MKTILTCTLALSVSLMVAQAEKKSTTVHIKKVENINGVEKVTDTTYTLNDASGIKLDEGAIKISDATLKGCDGKILNDRLVIINDDIKDENITIDEDTKNGLKTITLNSKNADGTPAVRKIVVPDPDGKGEKTIIMNVGEKMSDEEAKIFHEKKANGEGKVLTDIMIIKTDDVKAAEKDGKKVVKVFMINSIKVTELSPQDAEALNKITGLGDRKLNTGEIKFYPNPSNGRFNLTFDLPTKGDTEINVMDIEGKNVYSEKLPGFSGHYDKEIDISQNPKGTYFVKITQGDHTQVKKVVRE